MHHLKDLTAAFLEPIVRDRSELDFVVPAGVTRFAERLPDIDFTTPQEIRPVHVLREDLQRLLIVPDHSLDTKYAQLVLVFYAFGGSILYTKLPNGDYLAHLNWPCSAPEVQEPPK